MAIAPGQHGNPSIYCLPSGAWRADVRVRTRDGRVKIVAAQCQGSRDDAIDAMWAKVRALLGHTTGQSDRARDEHPAPADKRDECGCHRGCSTLPHECERPCRWPGCLTGAEQRQLVDDVARVEQQAPAGACSQCGHEHLPLDVKRQDSLPGACDSILTVNASRIVRCDCRDEQPAPAGGDELREALDVAWDRSCLDREELTEAERALLVIKAEFGRELERLRADRDSAAHSVAELHDENVRLRAEQHEMTCPACQATIRSRLADQGPVDWPARFRAAADAAEAELSGGPPFHATAAWLEDASAYVVEAIGRALLGEAP